MHARSQRHRIMLRLVGALLVSFRKLDPAGARPVILNERERQLASPIGRFRNDGARFARVAQKS